jgi:hypothetical protein
VLVVELMLRPRTVVFVLSVTVLVMTVKVVSALFIDGNDALPLGTVRPVIEARVALASWPISFWPLNSVTAPEYPVALS